MNRRPPFRALAVFGAIALGWTTLAFWIGPALIRLGHGGGGPGWLARMVSGTVPVEGYLTAWFGLARLGSAALIGALAVAGTAYAFPRTARSLLTRAIGGERDLAPGAMIWYGTSLGLLGGAAEALYAVLRQLATHRPAAGFYWEIVWMAPLAAGVASLFVCITVGALARIGGVRVGVWKVTLLFGFCMAYGVTRREGIPLFPLAGMVLSLGVASVLARTAEAHGARIERLIPTARPIVAAVVILLLAVGVVQRPAFAESRALAGRPATSVTLPNILLIVLDTVRAANMSLYGYERPTTPTIDEWAADGTVFERAYATSPWTLPTHASLFTGRYGFETGTGVYQKLTDSFPTLAEELRAHGYTTAGFVANLLYTTELSGLEQGFDRYEAGLVDVGRFLTSAFLPTLLTEPLASRANFLRVERKNAEHVSTQFLDWLDTQGDRPYFAFLNYYDAHEPYLPPPPYLGMFGDLPTEDWDDLKGDWDGSPAPEESAELDRWEAQYDGGIRYIDDQLRRIRAALEARGDLENTLVIVTSDHGEMWGELGQISHPHSLYLPLLRVPLMVSLPGGVPRGVRVDAAVTLRDVPATVLDLIGLDDRVEMPGRSLAPTWAPEPVPAATPSPLLAEVEPLVFVPEWGPIRHGPMRTLFDGGLQYVRNGDGSEELYDHADGADPWTDVSTEPQRADDLARLRSRLDSIGGA